MGLSSVPRLSANFHGQWTDTRACSHPQQLYSDKITIKSVPIADKFKTGLINTARRGFAFATLGISTWYNGGIKPLEHDCVQIDFTCRECKQKTYVTYEYGKRRSGETVAEKRFGYYKLLTRVLAEFDLSSYKELSYFKAQEAFGTFPGCTQPYSLVDFNCGHWARKFVQYLIKTY